MSQWAEGDALTPTNLNTKSLSVFSTNFSVFNVKDYGALGAGADSDTTIVRTVASVATGSILFFPAGAYVLSTISLQPNTTVQCASGATLLAASGASQVFWAAANNHFVDTTFSCNSLHRAGQIVFANLVNDVYITNCRIVASGGRGFDLNNGRDFHIMGCSVSSCSDIGIVIGAAAQHITVAASSFSNCLHGVEFFGSSALSAEGVATFVQDMAITGCTAENIRGAAFWGSRGRRITVTGCSVKSCADIGIDFEGVHSGAITGNVVQGGTNAGISLFYDCQDVTIAGNSVLIDGTGSGNSYGIWLTAQGVDRGYHRNIAITDNTVRNSFTTAQIIDAVRADIDAAHQLNIVGNTIEDSRIYVRQGGRFVSIRDNYQQLSSMGTVMNAIVCEGLGDYDVTNNTIIKDGDSGTTRSHSAIYTIYSSSSQSNQFYSITGNRIRGYAHSIADEAAGIGRSFAMIKDNLVSGPIYRTGTGTLWQGQIISNFSSQNPANAITETTY